MKRMLADVRPELINEWSQRNLPLTPDSVTHGSHKIVWWKGKCGHEWRASVKNRVIGGSGCPYCSHNAILEGFNDLASQKPELAAEWSDRNAPLLPTQVTVFANRKAWWKCKECGNEWETLITTRSDGSKCPYCSGYTLLKGFNDFATVSKNQITVLYLQVGKLPQTVSIDNSLEAMQQLVGGYIEEYMPFDDEVALICNEEGKMNGSSLNRAVYDEHSKEMIEIIAGDFFIAYAPVGSENFKSLPKDLEKKYAEKFKYPERFYKQNGQIKAYPVKPKNRDMER